MPPRTPPVDSTPVSRATAEHYDWGSRCEGWHLLRDAQLSIIEERMPPDTAEQRHRHARAQQFFYVLSGRLSIEVGGCCHELTAGSGLRIAPHQAHQVCNRGPAAAEFLVISEPPAQQDRLPVTPDP